MPPALARRGACRLPPATRHLARRAPPASAWPRLRRAKRRSSWRSAQKAAANVGRQSSDPTRATSARRATCASGRAGPASPCVARASQGSVGRCARTAVPRRSKSRAPAHKSLGSRGLLSGRQSHQWPRLSVLRPQTNLAAQFRSRRGVPRRSLASAVDGLPSARPRRRTVLRTPSAW